MERGISSEKFSILTVCVRFERFIKKFRTLKLDWRRFFRTDWSKVSKAMFGSKELLGEAVFVE